MSQQGETPGLSGEDSFKICTLRSFSSFVMLYFCNDGMLGGYGGDCVPGWPLIDRSNSCWEIGSPYLMSSLELLDQNVVSDGSKSK